MIAARQWWLARDGGPDAVRRAAIVLFFLAILSPAMLPWYLCWSLALAAALPWRTRTLPAFVAATVWLVLLAYPTGEAAMYDVPYLVGVAAVSALAAVSLVRPDPLRLSLRRPPPATRREPAQVGPASTAPASAPPATRREPEEPPSTAPAPMARPTTAPTSTPTAPATEPTTAPASTGTSRRPAS